MERTPPLGKLLAVLLAVFWMPAIASASPRVCERRIIYIQPVGSQVAPDEIAFVEQMLVTFYGADVRRLPAVPMPADARAAARSRYRADRLLQYLETLRPEDGYRILGVTRDDISATTSRAADWGVIGLASYETGACIISSARCGSRVLDSKLRRLRLGKVAVHELGHTMGLRHCSERGCLMQDAEGSVRALDREHELCESCWNRLSRSAAPVQDQVLAP